MKYIDNGGYQWPRRASLPHNVNAELEIRKAIAVVESLGADPLLTNAVVRLQEALDNVSDFVDELHPAKYNDLLGDRE